MAHEGDLRGAKYSDVARMVDTTERAYAGTDEAVDKNARSFAVRLKWLQEVTRVLKKREETTMIDGEEFVTVDAVVIDAGPEDPNES